MITSLHQQACSAGDDTYLDPETGFQVFTEVGLRKRGSCCGCGCRHCPYAHNKIPLSRRVRMARRPTLLTSTPLPTEPSDILFWSGGKDSFLTYLTLATTETPTVLLTTYDSQTGIIANQDHHIDQVIQQASHLGLSLIGVPLQPHVEFNDLVYPALELVPQISSLVFGDLHLEHIRSWREQNFAPLQYPLQFPLWHAEYDELLTRLEISGVPCVISAVTEPAEPYLTVGTLFSRASMAALPPHIDRFGENGEFHTLAKVWEAPSLRGGE